MVQVAITLDRAVPGQRRAGADLPLAQPPDATELLLHSVGVIYTEGFPHGTDVLSRALDVFVSAPVTGDENIRALEVAAAVARNHWADAGYDILTARVVALAREAGALSVLPSALDRRAAYCVEAGDLADAAEAYDEAEAIRQATGMEPGRGGLGRLAALRDEEVPLPNTSSDCAASRRSVTPRTGRLRLSTH